MFMEVMARSVDPLRLELRVEPYETGEARFSSHNLRTCTGVSAYLFGSMFFLDPSIVTIDFVCDRHENDDITNYGSGI